VKGKIASKHLATRFPEPSCPGCDPLAGFEVITYGRFWGVHRGRYFPRRGGKLHDLCLVHAHSQRYADGRHYHCRQQPEQIWSPNVPILAFPVLHLGVNPGPRQRIMGEDYRE
jgi:hypothetical protein